MAAGLSIGIISVASVAEAGIELNGTSLRGESSGQPQSSQQLKTADRGHNSTSLTGQSNSKSLPFRQFKAIGINGSSLKESSKQPQLSPEIKGRLLQGESLTGQSGSKPQPSQPTK